MAKNGNSGCLAAVIVVGLMALVALILLVVAFYFLMSRYDLKELQYDGASASASASAEPDVDVAAPQAVDVTSPDGAFVRKGSEQLYGYYTPKTTIYARAYRIDDIALGAQQEFLDVTKSGDMTGWAPVMIHIVEPADEATSAQESDGERLTMVPVRYSVVGDRIQFAMHDERAGDVSFDGTLSPKLIAHYIELGEASSEAVMKGDLTVNGKVYRKVAFTYNPGD